MRLISWTTVRNFGNVKYFNISYGVLLIVPILAELYNRAVPAMRSLGAPGPFPYTLRWLYGASLCYAIGITLYQYFCPPNIKRFADSNAYIDAQYDILERAAPHHRLEIVLAQLDSRVDAEIEKKISELRNLIGRAAGEKRREAEDELSRLVLTLQPDAIQRHLTRQYVRENAAKPMFLLISFVSYIAGTLILLGLLVQRSWDVLSGGI